MVLRHKGRYAIGLGLLSLALAGCSTSAPPDGTAAGTSTPATSSNSSPSSPTAGSTTTAAPSSSTVNPTDGSGIPDEARSQTADGAVSFTRYFVAQANQAYTTMDAKKIEPFSTATCKGCAAIVDSITSWRAKNYHYVGELISPTYVTISAFPKDGTAKVLLTNKTTGAKLLTAENSLVQDFPPEQGTASFALIYTSTGWKISEIQATS